MITAERSRDGKGLSGPIGPIGGVENPGNLPPGVLGPRQI